MPKLVCDTYRGFQITPKRDFGTHGFWEGTGNGKGRWIKRGYVVTDGCCNVMPGATWARSLWQARGLIDALIASNGDSDTFWQIVRNQSAA